MFQAQNATRELIEKILEKRGYEAEYMAYSAIVGMLNVYMTEDIFNKMMETADHLEAWKS